MDELVNTIVTAIENDWKWVVLSVIPAIILKWLYIKANALRAYFRGDNLPVSEHVSMILNSLNNEDNRWLLVRDDKNKTIVYSQDNSNIRAEISNRRIEASLYAYEVNMPLNKKEKKLLYDTIKEFAKERNKIVNDSYVNAIKTALKRNPS